MIYSMTGYGKAVIVDKELSVEVEAKSLNSKYLDLSIRLPRVLSDKEIELRNVVQRKIKRGKLSINLFIKKDGIDYKLANVDENALKGVINLLEQIKSTSGSTEEVSIGHVLNFQHLFFVDNDHDNSREFDLAIKAIEKALDQLMEMRAKEGETLATDLRMRIQNINSAVETVEKASPESVNEYFGKLKERAKELVEGVAEYDERLRMELALLSEKYDVTEECVRLKSHTAQFLSTLEKGIDVGRKLNFLTQEMNREANTINSKSVATNVSYNGIFIKEELEKIREQIQNIE